MCGEIKQRVSLQEARDTLPCTAPRLACQAGSSQRAAKRALQYLVHKGQATYDTETRRFS